MEAGRMTPRALHGSIIMGGSPRRHNSHFLQCNGNDALHQGSNRQSDCNGIRKHKVFYSTSTYSSIWSLPSNFIHEAISSNTTKPLQYDPDKSSCQ